MPAPIEFMQKRFQIRNHRPPTDLGSFDIDFNPATGLLLTTVKYALEFVNTPNYTWSAAAQTDFKGEFTQRVADHWNGKFAIACRKPGWDNVRVNPRFAFTEDTGSPHYKIKCMPTRGTANTAVRPDGTAKFGMEATSLTANAGMQRSSIKRDLKVPTVLPGGSSSDGPGRGAQFTMTSLELIKRLAQTGATAFGPKAGSVRVDITGFGSDQGKKNAERVKDTLERMGLKCKWSLHGKTRAPTGVSAPMGVLVAFNEKDVDRYAEVGDLADPRMSQATIVHEFGHMLGLPDEYNALCSRSASELIGLGRMGHGVEPMVRLDDMSDSAKDAAKSDAIEKNQQVFVRLCGEAGVPVPPFGRANDSVMSCGSRFLPSHCITVWDALCQATQDHVDRKDWELRLA